MKFRNACRFGAAALAAVVTLSAAGCGSMSPASLIDKAEKAQEKQDGMKVDLSIDIDVSTPLDETSTVTSELELSLAGSIESKLEDGVTTESMSDLEAKLKYLGMALNTSIQSYTVKTDDTHMTTYICQDGTWTKTTEEITEQDGETTAAESENNAAGQLAGLADKFALSGETEEVNSTECYKLTADLTIDELQESFAAETNLMNAEESVDLSSLFADKTFHVTYYIAKDTSLPVQAKVEMSNTSEESSSGESAGSTGEMTESGASSSSETESTGEETDAGMEETSSAAEDVSAEESTDVSDTDFSQCDMTMDFSWPDSVEIEVPAEAETAEEG